MLRATQILTIATCVIALSLSACSNSAPTDIVDAPAAPEMPDTWKVMSDIQLPIAQIQGISSKLKAKLSAVRNTVYDVGGKRIQINTILVPDAANATKLMDALRQQKSPEAILQKDLVVYEFVGQNDILPLMAEGRKLIEAM